MSTLLVRNADVLVTHDAARREIAGGGLLARDGIIAQVGPTAELPIEADEVLDLRGARRPARPRQHPPSPVPDPDPRRPCRPGRRPLRVADVAVPDVGAPDAGGRARVGAVGLAELALSGCTTSSDHLYLYPNGCRLDDAIEAAAEIGLRFHATRGSMSLGESRGGLPPDSCVEDEAFILRDSQRLVERYHDPSPGAMLRVALAPCSPFSVTPDLMRETATLARALGVLLHTHLAETLDEERFCLETVGHRRSPTWSRSAGWDPTPGSPIRSTSTTPRSMPTPAPAPASPTARPATCASRRGSRRSSGCGRPASASASASTARPATTARTCSPRRARRSCSRASASPSGGGATRQSREGEAVQLRAREALEIATLGGAAVLGRDDIGALAPGMCADFFAVDVRPAGLCRRTARPGRGGRPVRARPGGLHLRARAPDRARRPARHAGSAAGRRAPQPSRSRDGGAGMSRSGRRLPGRRRIASPRSLRLARLKGRPVFDGPGRTEGRAR